MVDALNTYNIVSMRYVGEREVTLLQGAKGSTVNKETSFAHLQIYHGLMSQI